MLRAILAMILGASAWLGAFSNLDAHQGPPFPIVVDRMAGPYIVSVWTDPDVGIGTFFVILTPASGTTLPTDNTVEVCVQPSSGRLPEACYRGTLQNMRNRVQYYTEVEFDQQEMWRVRINIQGANGAAEVTAEVEATPPGFGAWDLLIYGFPFILFGMLWLYAALHRRRDDAKSLTQRITTSTAENGGSRA